ncbi:MAG: CinA family nicotinamide mononucleotide deamidase-related protein [Saprospiraceae bacterium]
MSSKKISIVTIGDEILIGQIVDTNSAWIGEQLSANGCVTHQIFSIGDTESQIIDTLTYLSKTQDIIIMTGGLGPTKDDITVKSIAKFLNVPLVFNEDVYQRINHIFEKLNRPLSPSHREQCFLPEGVEILHNSMGTAPGMVFRFNHTILISMPGVPFEMKAIFSEEVLPKVILPLVENQFIQETFVVAGKGETEIEDLLQPLIQTMPPQFSVAYLPGLGQVRVRLTAQDLRLNLGLKHQFDTFSLQIQSLLSFHIVGIGDTNLETVIGQLCAKRSIKIGSLESCTGGRLAARITSISGASAYFMGGIMAYDNVIKTNLIGVPESIIQHYGAVSEETVKSMVTKGLDILGVDVAVSISGIAGPSGGTPDKPVGTVWVAVGNKTYTETRLLKLGKKREQNIILSAQIALNMLRLFILKHYT